jgi:hypothetical protein
MNDKEIREALAKSVEAINYTITQLERHRVWNGVGWTQMPIPEYRVKKIYRKLNEIIKEQKK